MVPPLTLETNASRYWLLSNSSILALRRRQSRGLVVNFHLMPFSPFPSVLLMIQSVTKRNRKSPFQPSRNLNQSEIEVLLPSFFPEILPSLSYFAVGDEVVIRISDCGALPWSSIAQYFGNTVQSPRVLTLCCLFNFLLDVFHPCPFVSSHLSLHLFVLFSVFFAVSLLQSLWSGVFKKLWC